MFVRTLALVAGLSALSPAHATEGVAWQWEKDTPRRYLIQAEVSTPEYITMWGDGTQPVISGFTLSMVVDCAVVAPLGKNAFELKCDVADASLIAAPLPSFVGRTKPVLDDWTALLESAWVQVVMTRDGKVRSVDLEDFPSNDRRSNLREETMRQMVERAFAVFDTNLPKKGDDKGAGMWVQRDSMVFAFPSAQGTLGGVQLTHKVVAEQGDAILWAMEGKGTIVNGETESTVARSPYEVDLVGSVRFDRAKGEVVEAQYVADGEPTASAARNEGIDGAHYIQRCFVRLIPEGTKTPKLVDNQE